MEDDEWPGRQCFGWTISRGQGKDRGSGQSCVSGRGESEVTFDGVGSGNNLDGLGLDETCAFARVGESVNRHAGKGACHERGAQQSLEVEDEIGRCLFPQIPTPAVEAEPAARSTEIGARENERLVDVRIALEERGPLGIDHPRDLRGGKLGPQGGNSGKGMDDIAEGTRLEDENAPGVHFPKARRSASSAGRPASRILRCVVSMS